MAASINHRIMQGPGGGAAVRSRGGFTLIEVLLAVVIASGLFLSVMLFYQQTADTREQVSDELDAVGSARRIMQHMTGELRAAAHPDTGAVFSGSTDRISFATTALPAASPLTDRLTSTGLIQVEYAVREDAEQQPTGLTRSEESLHEPGSGAAGEEDQPPGAMSEQTLFASDPDEEELEAEPESEAEGGEEAAAADGALLLTDQIRFMRFRYWDGEAWVDDWQGSGLPAAVEIMLSVEPMPEELTVEEYPAEVFRRTVSIGYSVPEDPDAAGMESEEDTDDAESGSSFDDIFGGDQ